MAVLRSPSTDFAPDDADWAERSEYWRNYRPVTRGAPKKFRYREPFILSGHGIRICIDHGTLLVRNGFTHYPQKPEEIRFFPGDANLPDRIIILDASGSISFGALNWMAEQKIGMVQLNWRGEAISIAGSSGYIANPKLVEAQWAAKTGIRGGKIARWLIAEKFEISISTLKAAIPKSEIRETAIIQMGNRISEIRNTRNLISISRLLGIEGICAAAYFKSWHGLPIKWNGNNRKPIPANWSEISPRTMGWRKRARSARHPLNAMLNYGYGILANQLRTSVIAEGLDPSVGVMHGNSQNRVPLVYDLMEPIRPVVDRAILTFAQAHTFSPGDFTITRWGGCRLNPKMTERMLGLVAGLQQPDLITRLFVRWILGAGGNKIAANPSLHKPKVIRGLAVK